MIIIALLTIITILSESFSPRVRETPCVGPRESAVGPRESAGHDTCVRLMEIWFFKGR